MKKNNSNLTYISTSLVAQHKEIQVLISKIDNAQMTVIEKMII
jgi:hypothetical protein